MRFGREETGGEHRDEDEWDDNVCSVPVSFLSLSPRAPSSRFSYPPPVLTGLADVERGLCLAEAHLRMMDVSSGEEKLPVSP